MRSSARRIFAIAWLCLIPAANALHAAEAPSDQGEYLFHVAGCAHCHTDTDNQGAPLAGGRPLLTPFGTFYTSNITPDPDTGIGRWSEADFMRALREGKAPDGRHYYPAFPYTSYTHLTLADLHSLWRYLSSRQAVRQENRPHELPWYFRSRLLLGVWKILYFEPGPSGADTARTLEWNRGSYLVNAVGHCGECHSPRNLLGGFKAGQFLAGNPHGVDDAVVPNITPDRKTGIGGWSESDIAYYLETGMTPDGDFAGDVMAEVIDHGTSRLTPADRRAIAVYLKSLPAIEALKHEHDHAPAKPKETKEPWE